MINNIPICGYFTPNDPACIGESDSISINNAVIAAEKSGVGKVVIPSFNARTGACRWDIDSAVCLPSNMHIVLDNAYLRQTDGSMDNVFRSANLTYAPVTPPDGELSDIRISGIGNAVIDGGKPNGLTQGTSQRKGFPNIRANNPILLANVDNFTVEGITIRNQRWWGMNLIYCTNGRISDMRFEADDSILNQDGIDLRIGCQNIIIERIRGYAGDDLIALSGFLGNDKVLVTEEKSLDIRHILIRDIVGTSVSKSVICLRNHDGVQIKDVTIDNVHDDSDLSDWKHPYSVVRVGQKYYFHDRRSLPGETSNIYISNIHAKVNHAVIVNVTMTESVISGVYCGKDVVCAVTTNVGEEVAAAAHIRQIVQGAYMRNTIIENIVCEPGGTSERALLEFVNDEEELDGMENVTASNIFASDRKIVDCAFEKGFTLK